MKIGQSIRFASKDSGGVLREGRGTIVDIKPAPKWVVALTPDTTGTLIVRLAKDWWGSYLRGREVRVYPDEVLPKTSN